MRVDIAYKVLSQLSQEPMHCSLVSLKSRVVREVVAKSLSVFNQKGLVSEHLVKLDNNAAVVQYRITEKGHHVLKALELLA